MSIRTGGPSGPVAPPQTEALPDAPAAKPAATATPTARATSPDLPPLAPGERTTTPTTPSLPAAALLDTKEGESGFVAEFAKEELGQLRDFMTRAGIDAGTIDRFSAAVLDHAAAALEGKSNLDFQVLEGVFAAAHEHATKTVLSPVERGALDQLAEPQRPHASGHLQELRREWSSYLGGSLKPNATEPPTVTVAGTSYSVPPAPTSWLNEPTLPQPWHTQVQHIAERLQHTRGLDPERAHTAACDVVWRRYCSEWVRRESPWR